MRDINPPGEDSSTLSVSTTYSVYSHTESEQVLRQTVEANVIVASSYNAVVKWSLRNSLLSESYLNIICGRSVKVTSRCRSVWSGEAAAVAAAHTKEDTSISCWVARSL